MEVCLESLLDTVTVMTQEPHWYVYPELSVLPSLFPLLVSGSPNIRNDGCQTGGFRKPLNWNVLSYLLLLTELKDDRSLTTRPTDEVGNSWGDVSKERYKELKILVKCLEFYSTER